MKLLFILKVPALLAFISDTVENQTGTDDNFTKQVNNDNLQVSGGVSCLYCYVTESVCFLSLLVFHSSPF